MGGVCVLAGASGHPGRASRVLEPVGHVTHILYVCYKQLSTDCWETLNKCWKAFYNVTFFLLWEGSIIWPARVTIQPGRVQYSSRWCMLYVCYKQLCTDCSLLLNKCLKAFYNIAFFSQREECVIRPARVAIQPGRVKYSSRWCMLYVCYKQLRTDCSLLLNKVLKSVL